MDRRKVFLSRRKVLLEKSSFAVSSPDKATVDPLKNFRWSWICPESFFYVQGTQGNQIKVDFIFRFKNHEKLDFLVDWLQKSAHVGWKSAILTNVGWTNHHCVAGNLFYGSNGSRNPIAASIWARNVCLCLGAPKNFYFLGQRFGTKIRIFKWRFLFWGSSWGAIDLDLSFYIINKHSWPVVVRPFWTLFSSA